MTEAQSAQQAPQTATRKDGAHEVQLRRAQDAFDQATALTEKQKASVIAFQESARLFEAAHAETKAAEAYFRAGEIDARLSRYASARRSFRKTLQLGQEPELRCKALSRIARTFATTGPFALADQYSSQALGLCGNLGEGAQAEAMEARGEALDLAGERAQSDQHLLRARALFAIAKDDNGQAQALLMLASHELFSSDKQPEGIAAAAQALQLWSSAENQSGIARMRSILGTFATINGDFEVAQCNYRIARPIFQELGNKDDEGSVLNGLGSVSGEMGEWQNSLHFFERARATFAGIHDQLGEIEAIRGMGKALLLMKSSRSRIPLYQAELKLARQAGDPISVTSALADTATAYEAEGRYAQAEAFYLRALEGYRNANHLHGEGNVLIRLGHLQAAQNKLTQAIASLQSADRLKSQAGEVERVAEIQYELAAVYLRANRLQDALAAIQKTIDSIEKQRVSISHFESRGSYFASVHQYYSLYIQALMLLDQQQPGAGFAEKAFNASERSKVRSLLDLITTSGQDAPCDQLLARQLAPDESNERGSQLLASAASGASTVTMAEVRELVEEGDTVLVEYALGEEKSYVWAIASGRTTAYPLPPSRQIKNLVAGFRKTLQPPEWKAGESAAEYQERARRSGQEFQTISRQLSRILLGPLDLGAAKRLLIVPDGSLQYLPFAALALPGAPAKPLISDYEVVTLPSASVLAGLRIAAANKPSSTSTAAIFADPVFEADDPRVSGSPAMPKAGNQDRPVALTRAIQDLGKGTYIPRLPASRNEANAIATALRVKDMQGVRVALDFDANRKYVLSQGLSQFRLIHFATHGVVDTRFPERSGLILSLIDRQGRHGDGYLRLADIYSLRLSADLVVLSACESALGRDLASEGIIGLPRAFLHAGAKSVIASLWKVNDEATSKLMAGLYSRIERGESPSSALRNAQLEMARNQEWSKPYYWAAFVLQGDYR
jgi:CHAT domain-containing protein